MTEKISPPAVINHKKLVIQDNSLIMASYSLSLEEQRLILASIEKAHSQKTPLKTSAIEITLTAHEYAKLYDVGMGTAYKALSKSSDKLYERTIRLKEEGVSRKIRWLQEQANYESGKVKLVFSDVVSRHIRDVVTTQTAYRLAQASKLRTNHSIRLFAIFQTVIDPDTQQGFFEISIDELKNILNIENFYERWVDLKKKVIDPAVRLINKNTSLEVSWVVAEKDGKRISKLKFIIFEAQQLTLGLKQSLSEILD